MAVARVACRAQVGLQAPLVHVEVSTIVPHPNAAEARAAAPAQVRAAGHLLEVCAHLTGTAPLAAAPVLQPGVAAGQRPAREVPADLADVRGQVQAKRALMIAAAGGHSLLKLESIGP